MKLLSQCFTSPIAVLLVAAAAAFSPAAQAIDELFELSPVDRLSGFQPATDATYQKECSGCHFTYLPGLLPARSWERLLDGLDRHFGENLSMAADTREALRRYLTANATDRSPYYGSKVLMESLPAELVPTRVQSMPRLRSSHRVMREVIARNSHVKVRTLVNCDGCHQRATDGDFSLRELRVEGLTGLSLIKSRTYSRE